MIDPWVLPTITTAAASGWLAFRHYARFRLASPEDRYMSLYGRDAWDSSNMVLDIVPAPADLPDVRRAFVARLSAHLQSGSPESTLLHEVASAEDGPLEFHAPTPATVDDLHSRRFGIWIDESATDCIRVVWNHMQTDGVGMWNALRSLFDPNPPLIPYRNVPNPPALVPEMLGLPGTARRMLWRGQLGPRIDAPLRTGYLRWDTEPIRGMRDTTGAPFNLVSSARAIEAVFLRHPDVERLNVGLTVYFPFLRGRNKYGVFTLKVVRQSWAGIAGQLRRQVRFPLVSWGISANQSLALSPLPDGAFLSMVSYYRRQLDVLISNLPVGQLPVSLDGHPVAVRCHPVELTLPYYFLLMGTRDYIDVSYACRFKQNADFCR